MKQSRHLTSFVLVLISASIAIVLVILPIHSAYAAGYESGSFSIRIGFLKPIFSVGIEKLSNAINQFRSVVSNADFVSQKDYAAQELEARRAALVSIVEFLIEEIDQSQREIVALSLNDADSDALSSVLAENRAWFDGVLDGIKHTGSRFQLIVIAHDIKQFRDQRHTILIRKIAELSLIQKQSRLLDLAQLRLDKISQDLKLLSERGKDITALQSMYESAQEYIRKSMDAQADAQALLDGVSAPYEEGRYRETLQEAHELLIASNIFMHNAYKMFVDMSLRAE